MDETALILFSHSNPKSADNFSFNKLFKPGAARLSFRFCECNNCAQASSANSKQKPFLVTNFFLITNAVYTFYLCRYVVVIISYPTINLKLLGATTNCVEEKGVPHPMAERP